MALWVADPRARLDTMPGGELLRGQNRESLAAALAHAPKLTLGWGVIRWKIKYLTQPNGPNAGQRYAPTLRQMLFDLHWYGLNPDGTWIYHQGARRLAKGSGKSPNAAAWALAEFCGPVRLDYFDPNVPGGAVGKQVSMPWVQIAAVSESQTENTMRMVRAFAKKGSRIVSDHHLDPGLKLYHKLDDGGKLEIVANSSASVEGAEATAVVGDETEHWLGSAGAEFKNTLADNVAKSDNRMIETCNSWKPGVGSVAEATFNDWVEQEELLAAGRPTKSGSLVLYDARIAPAETSLKDYESLITALQWVYDDCWWVKPESYIKRIWTKSAKPDDSKRKYLNWPTAPEGAWVTPQEWQVLAADGKDGRPLRELVPGERIVLFLDASKSRDATALLGCCMADGHVFTLKTWEPKQSHKKVRGEDGDDTQADNAQIDLREVDAAVAAAHEEYDVIAFWSDVREVEGFVKVTWPDAYGHLYDTKLWAVRSGQQPEPIAWDMRTHSREFAFAAELVEAEIREGAFTHDGDAVTGRHVANCRRADTRWGATTVAKETPNSPDKIDAAVCVIGVRLLYKVALANAPEPDEPAEAFFTNRWG
ncbi:terminase large subunit [Mycobacterium phage MalagasyRose]|uniref:Terminase large subunit n=1 Tax=Mycobacterium phage MalagasyRose TaxID=2599870 RepID=A0A5J6TGA2_9CAUD|nr:terminase large subunit [Mycobacterium phage MalagasyRose]QFG08857.1 terminase large subunit [Mycobacterium phage MalagasyRose]